MAYRHQHSVPLIRISDLITIHYLNFSLDHRSKGESHNFWEMVYVDQGTIHAKNADSDWEPKAGELLFHAPNVYHMAESNGKDESNIFIISFTCDSPAMEVFRDQKFFLPKELRGLIAQIMQEATTTYTVIRGGLMQNPDAPAGGPQLIRLYLEQLLIMLYRMLTRRETPLNPKELPNEMILYLNRHLYGTLSIPELCDELHYGKTHLSKVFKAATGQSILQYYNSLKVREAKRLLRFPKYTITEIANLLCYDTPQYFSRVFKSHTGLSPKEYRESVGN